jgi:1,4-alpha-glucan branching enzyme
MRPQPVAERFPALEEQEIKLTFFAPDARQVQIAGNFNGWQPPASPLARAGAGEWAIRLMLEAGQYEYRIVVDGIWCDDPRAILHTANPYGGLNAILRVGLDDRAEFL